MELAFTDYGQLQEEIGIMPATYSALRGDGRIDDVELAHEMALAEDPYREEMAEAAALHAEFSTLPHHQTFVRKGSKAKIFEGLIGAQKADDDDRCRHAFLYHYTDDVEAYTQQQLDRYEQDRTGDPDATASRVTNGFVASLAVRAAARAERGANRAAEQAFTKHRTARNIAAYETHLGEAGMTLFAPTETPEEINPEIQKDADAIDLRECGGDEEAVQLKRRALKLRHMFEKKTAIETLARAFGRDDISDMTRADVEALAAFIRDEGYHLTD